MGLKDYSDQDLQDELDARRRERLAAVFDAAQAVYHWARRADTHGFRQVCRETGGLSVGVTTDHDGEELVTIRWATSDQRKAWG